MFFSSQERPPSGRLAILEGARKLHPEGELTRYKVDSYAILIIASVTDWCVTKVNQISPSPHIYP